MSRKRFDEFYHFDGCVDNLKEKISSISIYGTSTTRQLSNGGFFFGLHDNEGKNKRLAIVFDSRESSEQVYDLLFGEVK